jgi:hypothetical protein
MPKIRTKKIGNIEKSGILNQNFRKTLRDDQHLSNFVLRDNFHNNYSIDNDVIQYNDNNTILFIEKSVNSTLGIEDKYFSVNNKLIHTPNNFYQINESSFNVNKITESKDYNHLIYENYKNELNNDKYKPFNEDFITIETISSSSYDDLITKTSSFDSIFYNKKQEQYQVKKDYEEINVNFNKQFVYMSFNKNTDMSIINNYVKFPSSTAWNTSECCFYAGTNNTLYLDKSSNNKARFLGHTNLKSGFDIDDFVQYSNYITHNPLTIYPDDVIGTSAKFINGNSVSNPISDFGFPYSNEYEGKNEVLVPASDFINEDFILEKIHVEFKLQNFAISNNQSIPCFNTLNFFVINQKEDINTINKQYDNLFYDANSDLLEIEYQLNPGTSGANSLESINRTRDITDTAFRSTIDFNGPFSEAEYESSGLDKVLEEYTIFNANPEDDKNKSRELITSIKIANIGNKAYGSYFSTLEGFDAVIETDVDNSSMTNWDGQNVYDNILNNDFKTVKVTKDISSYNSNDHLKRFSMFHVYPKQRSSRSGMDITSDRSWAGVGENVLENPEGHVQSYLRPQDKYLFPIDAGSENEISNPYILKPKDNLIFGFNFAPSMLFNDDTVNSKKYQDLTGRDVVVLDLSNLKIKLLGRYIAEGKVFKPKLNEFENKNVKKINEFATNVVDKTGLPQQFMLKGVYYDSYSSYSEYPNAISSGKNSFSNMINIPLSINSVPQGWTTLDGLHLHFNNVRLSRDDLYFNNVNDERIIDERIAVYQAGLGYTDMQISNEFYRFSVDHFGHFFDKENNHRHKALIHVKRGKSYFNVTKKFRVNGLYTQKTGNSSDGAQHVINSYNKDSHARIGKTTYESTEGATAQYLLYLGEIGKIVDGESSFIFIDGMPQPEAS